jgi:hypothetical protein
MSHQGLLTNADPVTYFGRAGIKPEEVLQSEQPQAEFDDADDGIDALLCIGFEPKPLRFER